MNEDLINGTLFKTGFNIKEGHKNIEERSVKYQIQVPSVFPSLDPDNQPSCDHINTMTNFYTSNLRQSEINKSDDENKKKTETPTRSADSSKQYNVQNTLISLDKLSKLSEIDKQIAKRQQILPELNRKSSVLTSIENETTIYNKQGEQNEYKYDASKSLKNINSIRQSTQIDQGMPYLGQFQQVKKSGQFNSFKRYSQNNIYNQNKIDRNSLNIQNIKFNDDKSQSLSEILQVNNPIQKLRVRKQNQINLDSSFISKHENNYDNLQVNQNRHKLTKSIDNQFDQIFKDSVKKDKLQHLNDKKHLLEQKNKNTYQKNMMLINLRQKQDKYQLETPSQDKKYETISQEVQLEGDSINSKYKLKQEQSRFKNEQLNFQSKNDLSQDELFNTKKISKDKQNSQASQNQMIIQENKIDQQNEEILTNFINHQIGPFQSNSIEQSFFSVATNRYKISERQSPKNKYGKLIDLEKKRIDFQIKNLDSVQIQIDRKMKQMTQIDEKNILEIPFSLLNAIGETLVGVVINQEKQIYSKQFQNLIQQLTNDLQNSKKVFVTCINQLNSKKDQMIQFKNNIIERQKSQIENLEQRLINEDKILNSERQREVRTEINDFLKDQIIMDAKLGGVFNRLNKLHDEKEESKKKNRTYQDLQDLLQLAMYSGANKEMIEILQQQNTILEIEKKNGDLVQIADFDRNLLDDDNSASLQNELNKMMLNKAKNVQKDTSKILVRQLVKNIEQKDNFSQTLNNDQQVIKDLEIMCGDYIKKYELLKQEQSGQKKLIDQLTAKNNSLKNAERALKDQIKGYLLKIEELNLQIIQEQEKNSTFQDQIEDQKRQQQKLFEQNYQKIQRLQEKLEYAESIIKSSQELKKAMELQINQLNDEIIEKQNSFQNLLNEKDEIIQKLQNDLSELESKQSLFVTEIDNLKNELQKEIEEKNNVQKYIEEMKNKVRQTSESQINDYEENDYEENLNLDSQNSGSIHKKKDRIKRKRKIQKMDAKSSIPKSNEQVSLSESLGSFLKQKREHQENSDKQNSSSIRQIASNTSNLVFKDKNLNSSFDKNKKDSLNKEFNQTRIINNQQSNNDSQLFDQDNIIGSNFKDEVINIEKQEFNIDLMNFNDNIQQSQYYLQLSQKELQNTEEAIKKFQENRIGSKIEVHQKELKNGKYILVSQSKQQKQDFCIKGEKVQKQIDTLRQYQSEIEQQPQEKLFFSQYSQTDIDTITFLKILNLVKKNQQEIGRQIDIYPYQKQTFKNIQQESSKKKIIKIDFMQQVNKQQIKKEIRLFEEELKNQAYFYAQNSSFIKHSVLGAKVTSEVNQETENEIKKSGRLRQILLIQNNDKKNKSQQADTTDDKNNNDSQSFEEEHHQIPFVHSYSQTKLYDQIFTPIDHDGSLYQNSRLEIIQEDKLSQNLRQIVNLVKQNNQKIDEERELIQDDIFKNEKELQKLEYSLSDSKSLQSGKKEQATGINQSQNNKINFNINFSKQQEVYNVTPESQKYYNKSLSPSYLMNKQKYSSIESLKNQSQFDIKLNKIVPIKLQKFKNQNDHQQVFKNQSYQEVKSQILTLNPPEMKQKKINKVFEQLDIIYSDQQLAEHMSAMDDEFKQIKNDKSKISQSSSVKAERKKKMYQEQKTKIQYQKLSNFQYKWPPQTVKKVVGGENQKNDNSFTQVVSK